MGQDEEFVTIEQSGSPGSKRQLPTGLIVIMWFLGLIEWSEPSWNRIKYDERPSITIVKSLWKRRILSVTSRCFLIVLLSQNLYLGGVYVKNYFGRLDKFYRFASYLPSLWSLMVTIQIVCLITSLRSWVYRKYYTTVGTQWWTVLAEEAISQRFHHFNFSACKPPKLQALLFFSVCPFACTVLEIKHFDLYLKQLKHPLYLFKYFLVLSSIINMWYFFFFCYFIHLQRIALQVHFDSVIWFVKNHVGELELCQTKINGCFNEYLRVRRLVHPWITSVICATAFGLAVHIGYNYNAMVSTEDWKAATVAPMPTVPLSNVTEGKKVDFYVLSTLIFVEKLSVLFLALFAVGGSDIGYVWKRCCLTLNIMYTSRQDKFWQHFSKLICTLNLTTSGEDNITELLLPLLLMAIGILGLEQLGF